MTGNFKKIRSRLRNWSQVRFSEPVVIIESDDWGLWRSPADKTLVEKFGKPKIWAYDQLENPDELKKVYEIIGNGKDATGQTPKLTANFITANPDFEATKRTDYNGLILKPNHKVDNELLQAWREGLAAGVFIPQYHGRLHFNERIFLHDIQVNKISRELFDAHWHGGLNNLEKTAWQLHSEYVHWKSGVDLTPSKANFWLKEGIEEFNKMFGFRPKSTIAPQYIFSPAFSQHFQRAGFTVVQGCNMQMFKSGNEKVVRNIPTGSKIYEGLVTTGRNVKFEPSRGLGDWNADAALNNARSLIKQNIPVIIDTHRINYTGKFAGEGTKQLAQLISGLDELNVRYMTSFELAEAILTHGSYKNFTTGKRHHITIMNETPVKKFIRDRFYW